MIEVRNGVGVPIALCTQAGDPMTAAWWTDLWRLGGGMSEGDRSVLQTGLDGYEEEEGSVIVTAAGSASDELWRRLVRVGYLDIIDAATLGIDPPLPDAARAFAITEPGAATPGLFLLLTAWSATRSVPPEEAGRIADALQGLPLPPTRELLGLRWDLSEPAFRFGPGVGSPATRFLGVEMLAGAGLIEDSGAGSWRSAPMVPFVAPVVLDKVAHERRLEPVRARRETSPSED